MDIIPAMMDWPGAGWGCYVKYQMAGAKSPNSVIVTPPDSQSHHNVTIPIRVNPRFAREERGSENPSRVKTLGAAAVHDNALISKSDRDTVPSHTFFFFFMDGELNWEGGNLDPVIFPETSWLTGTQRIIKTADWEVVTLTGTASTLINWE